MSLLPGRGEPWDYSDQLFTAVLATTLLGLAVLWALRRPAMRISPAGVTLLVSYGRSSFRATIPIAEIDGFEVRRWYASEWEAAARSSTDQTRCVLTVRLRDGRFVLVSALLRPEGASQQVLVRTEPWRRMRPLRTATGAELLWRAGTDREFESLLEQRLTDAFHRSTDVFPEDEGWEWTLGPCIDSRRGPEVRHGESPCTEAIGRIEPALPFELPANPGELLGDHLPEWTDLVVPATYRTFATVREGRLPGTRWPALSFAADHLELRGSLRTTRIPYTQADRFTFELTETSGWQLRVVLCDGSKRTVPGLSHGHFRQNRLQWWNSVRAEGPPAGELEWPDGGGGLAAARLNAQLVASRQLDRPTTGVT